MLEKILAGLRFSKGETRAYLRLLESGPSAAGPLAKKVGTARPSLYSHLKKLQDRGLVTQTMRQGVRIFRAEPPETVDRLFTGQIRDLQQGQEEFARVLPELKKRTAASDFLPPKFQMYEGVEGVRLVLMDMLLYRDIESWSFWAIKSAVELLTPEFFRFHNTQRIQNRMHVQAIWPQDQIINIRRLPFIGGGTEFFREIRIAPKDIACSMGYWIYGNKVAFLSSRRECYGFIIESTELAAMMKTQHQMIWRLSQPLKIDPADVRPYLQSIKQG